MHTLRKLLLSLCLVASVHTSTIGQAQTAPGGWRELPTHFQFEELVVKLDAAVKAHQMTVVNFASASDGAKAQGLVIPGNRVVGVFRNDFARRLLALNLRAGIEAPIRFYITENADRTATLSDRKPSSILEPYSVSDPTGFLDLALELDGVFEAIVADVVKN